MTVPSPNRMPVAVIACQVLQDMLERLLPAPTLSAEAGNPVSQVTMMDYGLHENPSKMTGALQDIIDIIEEPSLVVLGYGLCGNGLEGLEAREHTLLIPRTDDCIALLLGSYRAYKREFAAVPGTYYLSKGWLESGSHPLNEYHEYKVKYGSKKAMWIMDTQYQNYERLMLVAHTPTDLEAYRPQAQEVARFCERWGMRYEEKLGSDALVRRLVDAAMTLSQGLELPDGDRGDFLVIAPGDRVRQDQFIR